MNWLAALLAVSLSACAAEPRLEARDAWARATAGTSRGAVYLDIAELGGGGDRLVAVRSTRGTASLHDSKVEGGIARMRPVSASEGLAIPPRGTLRLAPGGAHVMLESLDAPLRPGERFALTLTFRSSPPRQLPVTVVPAEARSHAGH